MQTTFDAIIIGGGIHGASLAYHLASRGLKPLVVERSFLAAGATGRSSGLVRMHYDLQAEVRLAHVSFEYFTNWGNIIGGDCGFSRTGFLQLVGPHQVETLKANVAAQQLLGINTRLVTREEIGELAPDFDISDLELAAYEPDSGYADPASSTNALMSAARERGASLLQDCLVQTVNMTGGKIQGVSTTRGDFFSPILVNAAGPWSAGICELVGLDLPLSTWRHDTMFIKRPPELAYQHLTVIDFPNSMYFRPEGHDLTLVGLEDGNPLGASPDGDADHALPGFVEAGVERICKRIPRMQNAHLHSAHGGYDSITPDQHPALGPAGPEGFFLDTGFSGTGFKIAPAVGLCMSEWILDGKPSTVDVTLFSPERFKEGRPIQGEYPYESLWR